MRMLASLWIAFATALAALGAARAGDSPYTGPGSNTTGTGLYSCIGMINVTGQGPVKNYFYLTGAFPAPNAETAKLQKQWHDYVQSQDPGQLVSLANCSEAQSDPAKQAANAQGWIDKYKSQATITRTTWTYGQGATAATMTALQQQPVASAGNPDTPGYFCVFDDQSDHDMKTGKGLIVRYMTSPFESKNNFAKLGADWSAYIRATYRKPSTMNGYCMLNQGRYEDAKKTSSAAKDMKLVMIDWQD